MSRYLYRIVGFISKVHTKLLALNDANEYNFNDKQLHFIVIGVIGMLMVFVLQPLFTYLAKKDHVIVITWLYVISILCGLTLAIEIGQKIIGTGVMEFADIVFGLGGFILFFAIFALIRIVVKSIIKLFKE